MLTWYAICMFASSKIAIAAVPSYVSLTELVAIVAAAADIIVVVVASDSVWSCWQMSTKSFPICL